jgi:8-oxo-dGTP diphosphatase
VLTVPPGKTYNVTESFRPSMPRNRYRNPVPTVDIIIETESSDGPSRIVLIERKNPPPGWALPGGFVNEGESLEAAAVREAREETSLDVELLGQLHTYLHTISTVFVARAEGFPRGADDARRAVVVDPRRVRLRLAFDHRQILDDYLAFKKGRFPWFVNVKKGNRRSPAKRPT